MIADLTEVGQRILLAKGGNGGFGNAYFKTSTNQAPRRANPGQEGVERTIWLRLKLIADAGLVGLPNAGKSTLTNRMVGAKVSIVTHKVQTTRARIRGVALEGDSQIVFVDTPGLFQPRRRLDRAMVAAAWGGVADADITVLLIEAHRGITHGVERILETLNDQKGRRVVLAINKIDKPQANPTKVRTDLLQHEVVVEQMSGEVQDVEVSATTGQGLDDLLEAIALQAEILELKANPKRAAQGAVIEAQLDVGRGPVATVLVQNGTLKTGDVVAEQLRRLAGIERDVVVEEVRPTLGWRTRVTWSTTPDGRPGLRKHRSHEVVPVDHCPIAHPDLPDVTAHRWDSGPVEAIVSSTGQRLVVTDATVPSDLDVDGVAGTDGHRRAGGTRLTEHVAPHDFTVTGSGFWQVHPEAARTLVDAVLDAVEALSLIHI